MKTERENDNGENDRGLAHEYEKDTPSPRLADFYFIGSCSSLKNIK